jgi:hypothetical protein
MRGSEAPRAATAFIWAANLTIPDGASAPRRRFTSVTSLPTLLVWRLTATTDLHPGRYPHGTVVLGAEDHDPLGV